MKRRGAGDLSDDELESLWRVHRNERRAMAQPKLESRFPQFCDEIDRLVRELKLSDHIAFLLKGAIATDDQRFASAAIALAEHGLAARRTPEHLQTEYSARHPDGEVGLILNAVEQLDGEEDTWRAAGWVAALIGVDSTSFNAARHAVWQLARKGAKANPYSAEAMPTGTYLLDGKTPGPSATIGPHILPGTSIAPAIEHLAHTNAKAVNARSLTGKPQISSKNTPKRTRGK